MIKGLHHIGIVVKNIDESAALYERLLGIKPLFIKDVPDQNGRVAVFKIGKETEIEFIEATGSDAGVKRFLEKRGEGIHHICFEVDDVDKDLQAMEEKGVVLIDKQGKNGLAGRIGFLHPKSTHGVLIELVQRETQGSTLPPV